MLTLTRRPHEEIVVIDTQTGERIVVAGMLGLNEYRFRHGFASHCISKTNRGIRS